MASKRAKAVGKNSAAKSDLLEDEATATAKMPKKPLTSDRGRKTGPASSYPLEGSRPGETRIG